VRELTIEGIIPRRKYWEGLDPKKKILPFELRHLYPLWHEKWPRNVYAIERNCKLQFIGIIGRVWR